jgi:O-antigen ligase
LVLWWIYMRNVFPAILIGAGLLATVTRSGVIAAVAGLVILGVRRRESARLAVFGCIAIVGLIIAIQALNLNHFLAATFTEGADTSRIGHVQTVNEGISALLDHPLGLGAGTIGQRRLVVDPHAMNPESSFIAIALEYGILTGLLYFGFFVSCLWSLYKVRRPLGDAAFSILLGYGVLLAVGPIHFDIPLACWVWIPVGMGVTRVGDLSQRRSNVLPEPLLVNSTNKLVV